jgi:hypothetical protein
MTAPRRFKNKRLQAAKSTILKARRKRGGAEWEEALGYEALWTECGSGDEFRNFLMDPADGLGFPSATAGVARRMVSALKTMPEKVIWERLGWQDGVCTIERVPNAIERQTMHDVVLKKLGKGGRGKLGKATFKDLLREHAPSLEVRDAHAHQNSLAAKVRELEALLKYYRQDVRTITRNVPQTRDVLSDPVREDLARSKATRSHRRTAG